MAAVSGKMDQEIRAQDWKMGVMAPPDFFKQERRITDPNTGGQKGQKAAQLGSLDPVALLELAKVSGFGADKYEAFNFLRGYDWRLSFDALQRHSLAFWSGEELDQESGLPHMAHAAWHALALVSFLVRDIGTDTRPAAPNVTSEVEGVAI